MDKDLKNKDLEQVSGGGIIIDPPGPRPTPGPQPKAKKCADYFEFIIDRLPPPPIEKKLYDYCDKCTYWEEISCRAGHF